VAALALLALAGTAQASSIVFVRGGDVWLATPDGTREQQLTRGADFLDVTQADDGTIFARRPGQVYKLDQYGRQLGRPLQTIDMFDLDVTPDGSKLTFWYLLYDGGYINAIGTNGDRGSWDDENGEHPSWIDNDLYISTNGAGYIQVTHEGNGGTNYWKESPGRTDFHSVAITRAKDRLVATYREWDINTFEEFGPWKVAHYSNTSQPPLASEHALGTPPADQQPTLRCTQEIGPNEITSPRFSPDGTQILWVFDGGVRIMPVYDLDTCSQPPGGFTIDGAISADWGPADVPTKRCVVPQLKNKKLAKAKGALKKASCRLGKVKKAKSGRKRGTVLKQSPKAGAVGPAGMKVGVTVAR
jgi:hypothetical protein